MNLYPLKFTPLSKYRIWGGNKLNTILNKGFQADNIGESWEISDVEGGKTKVCNGALTGYSLQQLAAEYKDAFVGKNVYDSFGTDFPLLIKFIDAKTPLSIQVHPNDAVAKERHESFGKNEMWYVMQGDENAELIVGFDKALNKKSYQEYLDSNKILDVMHHETVQKGDTFYIPAGRVHAIGAGVLLAEIQQTSDVTYRIYDYERVDKQTGKTRELHNDLALDIIDFEVHQNYKTDYSKEKNYSNTLVHAPYFKSNYLNIEGTLEKDYSGIDSFIIYICISGSLTLIENEISYSLVQGETILIPASIDKINLHAGSNTEVLEVYY